MKLTTAGNIQSSNVSEEELREAFANDRERGEFIILSQGPQQYIQAAGEGNDPYTLEYRDGDRERHFQCTSPVTKDKVETVFIQYLKRDESWKTDFSWEKMDFRPWWKFW
ncbi:hypothetical protein GF362_02135 [Candidatus Dojkabacteria bacterium]|nr:hypothetical protein [Candidatus Dojkabacteria bacterium]